MPGSPKGRGIVTRKANHVIRGLELSETPCFGGNQSPVANDLINQWLDIHCLKERVMQQQEINTEIFSWLLHLQSRDHRQKLMGS